MIIHTILLGKLRNLFKKYSHITYKSIITNLDSN